MDLQFILNGDAPSSQLPISFPIPPHSPPPLEQAYPDADPYAAGFLRQQLGLPKWVTFSTKLFERRLGGPRSRTPKSRSVRPAGASAVDFLHKVEIVKELLRNYVPHPYNPVKSLSHSYAPSPTGQVILTRSTVLGLSGWSNTQFSYWARRSEAVSVLARYDRRLQAIANTLLRRLRAQNPSSSRYIAVEGDEMADRAIAETITGKGLDSIVESVKEQTGASQFLRGKHSSLDPFGTTLDQGPSEQRPQPMHVKFIGPIDKCAVGEPKQRSAPRSTPKLERPTISLPSVSHILSHSSSGSRSSSPTTATSRRSTNTSPYWSAASLSPISPPSSPRSALWPRPSFASISPLKGGTLPPMQVSISTLSFAPLPESGSKRPSRSLASIHDIIHPQHEYPIQRRDDGHVPSKRVRYD